jgi:hypothetical protein
MLGLVGGSGHVVDAGGDWGYGDQRHRRKLLAWSKNPWRELDFIDHGAAKGRLLSAVTHTNAQPVRVIAVCIPWRDAHVRTGRADAGLWDEHIEFCDQLREYLQSLDARAPTVVIGDFNQRVPGAARRSAPAATALAAAFDGLTMRYSALRAPPWLELASTCPVCRSSSSSAGSATEPRHHVRYLRGIDNAESSGDDLIRRPYWHGSTDRRVLAHARAG